MTTTTTVPAKNYAHSGRCLDDAPCANCVEFAEAQSASPTPLRAFECVACIENQRDVNWVRFAPDAATARDEFVAAIFREWPFASIEHLDVKETEDPR